MRREVKWLFLSKAITSAVSRNQCFVVDDSCGFVVGFSAKFSDDIAIRHSNAHIEFQVFPSTLHCLRFCMTSAFGISTFDTHTQRGWMICASHTSSPLAKAQQFLHIYYSFRVQHLLPSYIFVFILATASCHVYVLLCLLFALVGCWGVINMVSLILITNAQPLATSINN